MKKKEKKLVTRNRTKHRIYAKVLSKNNYHKVFGIENKTLVTFKAFTNKKNGKKYHILNKKKSNGY